MNATVPPHRPKHATTLITSSIATLIMTLPLSSCTNGKRASQAAHHSTTVLDCHDSAGQQSADPSAQKANGIASPALRGDTNIYDSLPKWKMSNGQIYIVWKAFIAVAPSAKPYRTVTVLTPRSGRLFYASPTRWGSVSNDPASAAPSLAIRISACSSRYAGYTGGILMLHPGCIILSVTGPTTKPTSITVPILVTRCASDNANSINGQDVQQHRHSEHGADNTIYPGQLSYASLDSIGRHRT